ncbi:hypothetical protein DL770_011836 [Monosporascus sp. CRB-9-2]|nr:hypothetical protein DL770_011836 [Monosporascus sp. CRB-9-2]
MSEARNLGEGNLEEKEARLRRELEELNMAEKVRDLERQVEAARRKARLSSEDGRAASPTPDRHAQDSARMPPSHDLDPAKRIRDPERQVETSYQTAQQAHCSQEILPAPIHSKASLSGSPVRDRNVQASIRMDPSPSPAPTGGVLPLVQRESSASTGISGASTSVRGPPIPGGTSTGIEEAVTLQYYQELDVPADDSAELSFFDMDLEQLYGLASALEENLEDDVGQLKLLSSVYYFIFSRTRGADDIQKAIDRAEKVVMAVHIEDTDYAHCLRNLIIMLMKKYERTRSLKDLDEAILRAEVMLTITDRLHPDRPHRLMDLIKMKGKRALQTSSPEDLDELMFMATEAMVTANVPGINQADHHLDRFKQTVDLNSLNIATGRGEASTYDEIDDQIGRAVSLAKEYERTGVLPAMLGRRFERTGSMDDLNRAVDVADMAVDATPQDHPDRASMFNNLGNLLGRRFERTGSIDDLNRAVDVADMAVNATPQDHPDRAAIFNNLGNLLSSRFERTGSMDDFNRTLTSYKMGWRCYSAPPSIRIRLARNAAGILASQANWEESSLLLQDAVNLLPTVSPRLLKHTDKQHMLADFAGLASMAAATALNSGKEAYRALQLLELGRGIIAGLLMEMRSNISDLQQQHPNLADEFTSLRDELDKPTDKTFPISTDDTLSWESQAKRRRKADQNFSELITRIRIQPGFHNFLLPPTADELIAAADPNPIIIINLSSYRCDAFIIQRDRIRVLELPDLTLKDVRKWAGNLRESRRTASFNITPLLRWLWDVAARPSLDALGFREPASDNNCPRVWWIPTGLLSQLPLHAAGHHALGSTETVLDRVMSSYASSVKALIYGRRHHIRKPAGPLSDHALLVAMRDTPGMSTNGVLPYAADEVKMLEHLCPSLQLKPIIPTLRKDDVLKHLQACRIFHFAGHGQSDPMEPSQSCLLLEDWKSNPLTVEDLRNRRFQENPPFLGYLSACSTGANEAARLADEGIHLVSAFQLAGFRHVVGTLWEVSDKHCVDVARVLYETLRDEGMTDVAVCRGLHRAVRALRDGRIEKEGKGRDAKLLGMGTQARGLMNPYWIPYVHFGT